MKKVRIFRAWFSQLEEANGTLLQTYYFEIAVTGAESPSHLLFGAAAQKHGRAKATDARFETMIGRSSWIDSLFVWFPAAWMPLVIDSLREKVTCTIKVSVSWAALLSLLTNHILSCRRHKSSATGSSGGRRTKVVAVLSYNYALTLTGSHLTRKCLLLFSPDCTKESFMMFSYRRQTAPSKSLAARPHGS